MSKLVQALGNSGNHSSKWQKSEAMWVYSYLWGINGMVKENLPL